MSIGVFVCVDGIVNIRNNDTGKIRPITPITQFCKCKLGFQRARELKIQHMLENKPQPYYTHFYLLLHGEEVHETIMFD